MSVIDQIRYALRGRGIPPLLNFPPDSRQGFVYYPPPQGDISVELGGQDSSVEVLIVGAAPTNIEHEGYRAGLFTSGRGRIALDRRPLPRTVQLFPMSAEKPKGSFFVKHKDSESIWPLESVKSQWNGLKRKFYKGKDILASYKKWPGLFQEAGIDARGLLYEDFEANSSNAIYEVDKLFTVGVHLLDKETVAKLLFRGKYCKSTLDLNSMRTHGENAIADTVASTLMFHDVLGPHTTVMLHIPYPYLSQKLEVSTLYRFAGFTGQISSSAPHLEASCLLGTQLFAAGCLVQLNRDNGDVDYSLGITSRIRTLAGSFIVSNKGKVNSIEASLFKKFENEVSSIAVTASHSFENQPWDKTSSAIIGVAHELPHSVTIKGRLSSKGIASALVKLRFWDNCSLVLSTDVEMGNVQKVPKYGVLFSIQ